MRKLVKIGLGIVIVLVVGVGILAVRGILHDRSIVKRFPPPGQMIDIDGRRLHLLCKGSPGNITVIFEGGAFGASPAYWKAQDLVAPIARACTYDRAGLAWSDPAPLPRSLLARVEDLHALLERAKIPPPYIMIGHSLGGLLVRMYAQNYPGSVTGMVLAESSEEHINGEPYYEHQSAETAKKLNVAILLLRAGFEITPLHYPNGPAEQDIIQRPSVFVAAQDDFVAMSHLTDELRSFGLANSLGDLPLVVIQRGKRDRSMTDAQVAAWKQAQARLAQLSTRSISVVAEHSGHNIMLDQPELFADAVSKILAMQLSHQ